MKNDVQRLVPNHLSTAIALVKDRGRNMELQDLNSYKVTSIRTNSGMTEFGKPEIVCDEGSLFRIAELYVIWKGLVDKCEMEGDLVRLIMKNGDEVEIGVVR